MTTHLYDVALTWTGSTGDYRTYDRKHEVVSYEDDAEGGMPDDQRPMRVSGIVLHPHIRVRGGTADRVHALLHTAHEQCYIANSLSTDIRLDPTVEVV